MSDLVSFIATGDSFITRRLPEQKSKSTESLISLIGNGDVRFTNFEVITPGPDAPPAAFSGGTWARADHRVIRDLKSYGFNCVNAATNHVLDYLYDGLINTQVALEREDLLFVGVGQHMDEASAPKYIETLNARVALIGATSTFHESWMAGSQRRDGTGRPGVNGLRLSSIYKTSKERLKILKDIAEQTGINHQRDLDKKEGFLPKDEDGKTIFGEYVFEEGGKEESVRNVNSEDMNRIISSIHEAKRQADYTLISIHSHEMEGNQKDCPADFLVEACHKFVDEGADAVIGHGPHILRGIELYNGRPIFYSLGNFIFQNETVERLPSDFYRKYGLTDDHNVADAFDYRSQGGKIGLGANPLVWESVVAEWKMDGGQLVELILHPIELGFNLPRYKRGWPSLSNNTKVLENLRRLSEPFGTEIEIKDGKGHIKLKDFAHVN